MKVLIDTNIVIHREASRVVNEDIGTLFNWLDRLGYKKCVHPHTIGEISSHQNEEVVRVMTVKVKSYYELKTTSPDDDSIKLLRAKDLSANDSIDTDILKELYNGRVSFLITEDRGIHSKAKLLKVDHLVFKISGFLEKCIVENPELKSYKVLSIRKEHFGNINLNDVFFDSFRQDYSEFNDWFNRKADSVSYVCFMGERVVAFLYLKVEGRQESYSDIYPKFESKKRLKIGTLKVASTGLKLGERFLKVVFDNALLYGVDDVYVTVFDKREEQTRLIAVLLDWGFWYWGKKTTINGEEKVYIKTLKPPLLKSNPKLSYPFVSRSAGKWIVSIYPEYHTELFPDSILNNESPCDFSENEPYRNAIKKVFVSRSIERRLSRGDLVLFYRTGGHYKGVVSTIGVVESVVTDIKSEAQFIQLCRKRSVYDNEAIRDQWNFRPENRPFVVNFLYLDSFPAPKVNLKKLRDLQIMQEAPRGFVPLSDDQFYQILKEARANEDHFID